MSSAKPFVDTLPRQASVHDIHSGERFSQPELASIVDKRATEVRDTLASTSGPVVVGEADAVQALTSLFAVWGAGRMAVMVNPALAAPERRNVAEHTHAAAWISEGGSIGRLETETERPAQTQQPLTFDVPALMMMTSGTTGVPKGIVHSIRSLTARLALNMAHIGAADMRRSLCVLPTHFGHGLIGNCLTPLVAGGELALWTTPQLAEIERFSEILDTNEISFMSSVPTFWKLALRLKPPERQTLLRVHVGSAPLSLNQWREIAAWTGTDAVYNMFGMTETANWIGGGTLHDSDGRDGFVGRVWGGAYAILTEEDDVRREGRGEVLVASPSIMLGYHGDRQVTEDAFKDGWFRTGDVGELTEDGALTLVGRIKSEINRAGIKVLAEEIDMMLERHEAIDEACAFGVPDPVAGEAVAAAIVLRQGTDVTTEAIRQWCRSEVRAEAVPSRLFVVPAIPRNDRGKIVRSAVRSSVLPGGD